MVRHRINEFLRIIDNSFSVGQHSFLANLANVTPTEWEALPAGAERTIRDIVAHIGMFKFMYANHGFYDASMDYGDNPATPPEERLASPGAAKEWLQEGHAYLRAGIDSLTDDSELDMKRKAHWGQMVPTIQLIDIMHEHDVYHAGEINRTRGMLQGNDGWSIPAED
jgi:hypothetical protein